MLKADPKPKIMVFFTSFECNLRCAMCFAWSKQKQTHQLSLGQIQNLFADSLIRDNLEIVNITGGEPTLRADLTEIIQIILRNCSNLRRIDLSTNGVNTAEVIDQAERILTLLLSTHVKLTISISLDGVGQLHERIRGSAGIFTKIEQTTELLKELMLLYPFLSIGFNMTVSRLNYQAIEQVHKYAANRGLGINFTLAAFSDIGVESSRVRAKFEINQEKKEKTAQILHDLLLAGKVDPQNTEFMLQWLKTGKRSGNCAFSRGRAFLLEPDGQVYICGNFKEFRLGNVAEQTFQQVWRNAGKVLRTLNGKCINCNSNCYMNEAS
ncbi:radical SAM protein [Candidatus Omnitrophota bacterium]